MQSYSLANHMLFFDQYCNTVFSVGPINPYRNDCLTDLCNPLISADIACELSQHASQVYLSVRTGTWVVSRLSGGGVPGDLKFLSRFVAALPKSWLAFVMRHLITKKLDVASLGLEVKEPPDKRYPIVNDELPNCILTGSIQVRADIAEVQGNTIYLNDESKLEEIDAIIFATGYNFSFPFLSDKLLCSKEKYIPLYKYIFPPNFKPSTLAIVGALRVNGPVPPLSEIQCRWAANVFAGKANLPDMQTVQDDVETRQKILEANTIACCRSFHLVRIKKKSIKCFSLICSDCPSFSVLESRCLILGKVS